MNIILSYFVQLIIISLLKKKTFFNLFFKMYHTKEKNYNNWPSLILWLIVRLKFGLEIQRSVVSSKNLAWFKFGLETQHSVSFINLVWLKFGLEMQRSVVSSINLVWFKFGLETQFSVSFTNLVWFESKLLLQLYFSN